VPIRYDDHPCSAEKTMQEAETDRSTVLATAQDILPRFGLAFLIDDHDTTWGITRSMQGPGLNTLRPGQRVQLTLDHHPEFSLVRAYDPQS
jgi:hypothetical protein